MLPIHRHRNFVKQFKKLPKEVRNKFEQRIAIFTNSPFSSELNNHPLSGKWEGCNGINITGDYRAIYYLNDNVAVFIRIGTHSELYGK
jgi:mRNA interferase YafQ